MVSHCCHCSTAGALCEVAAHYFKSAVVVLLQHWVAMGVPLFDHWLIIVNSSWLLVLGEGCLLFLYPNMKGELALLGLLVDVLMGPLE